MTGPRPHPGPASDLTLAGRHDQLASVAGSATSSVAHLTVLITPPVQISASGITSSNVSISVTSVSGLTYRLEYKDGLDDPSWTPVPPPLSGSGGPIILLDTNSPPAQMRFYRVTAY